MAVQKRAKIVVEVYPFDIRSKYFIGTEDEIYAEALDWQHEVALEVIDSLAIEDPDSQDMLIADATHTIIWDNEPNVVYALCDDNSVPNVIAVYVELADAEEAFFTECESWAYEMLMNEDPVDFWGVYDWDYPEDYKYLMRVAADTFKIEEVAIFN